ncbi:hypothetical protein AVEN_227121-1 [Araneus ventricosus]|uniref:Uncharacterized protein n=1 Tax=Araneus ventricosus TaxID=182803 RepID=A0A4Y2BWM4_ARAVE|nr:hypothetical protein AVEN_227121-1 [Araneus ventricosus]
MTTKLHETKDQLPNGLSTKSTQTVETGLHSPVFSTNKTVFRNNVNPRRPTLAAVSFSNQKKKLLSFPVLQKRGRHQRHCVLEEDSKGSAPQEELNRE